MNTANENKQHVDICILGADVKKDESAKTNERVMMHKTNNAEQHVVTLKLDAVQALQKRAMHNAGKRCAHNAV